MIDAAISTACRAVTAPKYAAREGNTVIGSPSPLSVRRACSRVIRSAQSKHRQCEDADESKHQACDRRCVSELVVRERLTIEVGGGELARTVGSPAGHHVYK